MTNLILIRHGQSVYNQQNKFTGWVDSELSPIGEEEARKAGDKLRGFGFDIAYTSVLKRAIDTLSIILDVINQKDIPIKRDKALNERNYGKLVGMNKDSARKEFGVEQVHIWRRSYDIAPPGGESLKDTALRVIPYFEKNIMLDIKNGKNVIVSAHGNSLRAIVMKLDNLTNEEVVKLEIPTGMPILYEFDKDFKIIVKKILSSSSSS